MWTNLEGVAPEALPAKAAELIGPYVKMGDEPLVYQGRPINTLEEYLRMLAEAPSLEGWTEIAVALGFANSIKGGSATFSERLSGGFTTTRPQSP